MNKVKNYILSQVAKNSLSQNEAKEMLLELKTKPEVSDVAIIGMSCRYSCSENVDEYWYNLKNGINCIRKVPNERLNDIKNVLKIFYNSISSRVEEMTPEAFELAGYLSEVDKFDAGFFRIPPREAKFMDPLQRNFLETAYHSIEDGGYGGRKLYGTRTGVFLGYDFTNASMYKHTTEPDPMHVTGSWTGIMATRISYIFDFRGPGMVIDTACSSSLVAIHEACRAIQLKECDMAVAGGVCIFPKSRLLDTESSLSSVESSDYTIRAFDKNANGTVWGEGVGALLLKPLHRAVHDRDNIYAVIKGSAVNNDGMSNGITAPNGEAQEDLLQKAWENAGIDPESISYIEMHGTGTKLGDPIEIKGIANAFKKFTGKSQFCGIGSVKPNIGHTVGSSGVASVIKVVLSLKNGMIPPSLNFNEPNPYIHFCTGPVYINDKLNLWKKGNTPRRAGVNSFGFSGTNCHIVLEEAPNIIKNNESDHKGFNIFTLSARSESILEELIKKYAQFTENNAEENLDDLCYTANTGRGHYGYRLAFILKDYDDFRKKIIYMRDTAFYSINQQNIFFGQYKIVNDKKELKEKGDVTEIEVRHLSKYAVDIINKIDLGEDITPELLAEIAGVYIKGADIDWEVLYKRRKSKKLSLPVYQLERVRMWANPLIIPEAAPSIAQNGTKYNHPLIDCIVADSIYSTIYSTNFEPSRHWVLSDHKIMGNCVIPGTTFLEMAREAGRNFFKNDILEFRDVLFTVPLVVGEGENIDVQMVIKKEENIAEFVIASKNAQNENNPWMVHAEGKILKGVERNETLDMESIKSKCRQGEFIVEHNNTDDLNQIITFGPRWKNTVRMFYGENDLLLELNLPDGVKSDSGKYGLHPAMMDNAVNAASQSIGEGLYLPLSYKQFLLFKPMPERFYSHIQKKGDKTENLETISFNITLIDLDGHVFAEINNYTVKKVRDSRKMFEDSKLKSAIVSKIQNSVSDSKDITIKGASDESLVGTRLKLAGIWAKVLGLNEIDIFENFYNLGGDSILAGQLLKELDKEYPGLFIISDIFSYPSVALMEEYINKNKRLEFANQLANESIKANDITTDNKLMELLERLEKGEVSVMDGMDILIERKPE